MRPSKHRYLYEIAMEKFLFHQKISPLLLLFPLFNVFNFSGSTKSPQLQEVSNLLQILRWPKDYVFPSIDIARLAILNPPACHLILSKHSEEFIDILLQNLALTDKVSNQMLALKSLANLFSSERGNLINRRNAEIIVFKNTTYFLIKHYPCSL